jgi:hypothetical protein
MASILVSGGQPVRPHVFLSPLALWVVLAIVAIVNGGFREVILIPRVGRDTGHVVSTGLLVAAILVLSFLYFRWSPVGYTRTELVVVGGLWTVLTVGFEFLVGYIEGTPVSVTIGQYDVLAGEVWIAVPLTLFFAPLVFGWYLAT